MVYAGWAVANQRWQGWALFLLYGIYAAATEGVSKALVADVIPKAQRGHRDGLVQRRDRLRRAAGQCAGRLAVEHFGPGATFGFGAWAGFAAAALMIAWIPWFAGRRAVTVPEAPPAV